MNTKFRLLIAAMLFMAVNQAFAASVTKTYVFASEAIDENAPTEDEYEIEDGVFDFSLGNYGSGMVRKSTSQTADLDQTSKTWKAGFVTMTTYGRVLLSEGGKLYLYKRNDNKDIAGTLELSIPNGVITEVSIEADYYNRLVVDCDGEKAGDGVWTGSFQKMTVKHDGTSGGVAISKITVTYVPASVNVTIGSAGYITYCSKYALDFSGVNAYVVSEVSEDAVTLTKVEAAPANTPVILNAKEGEYALNVSESVDKLGVENYLKVSDGNVSGGDDVYALALKDGVVGFNVVNESVTIPKGKCYLKANGFTKSRLEFDFGLANAVERVEVSGVKDDGVYYNLNGQRVVNPSNGIYILNNRKVLIK